MTILGWHRRDWHKATYGGQVLVHGWSKLPVADPKYPWDATCIETAPDYPNDLNAMREARRTLTMDQQRVYAEYLVTMIGWDRAKNNLFRLADADAHIHAEAFIRVHNRWEEPT